MGRSLSGFAGSMGGVGGMGGANNNAGRDAPPSPPDASEPVGRQQQALAEFMARLTQSHARGYRDGGHVAAALRVAARETNTNPTAKQKEAGNYAKGRVRFAGLDIAIENPKGSERSGVDRGG